MKVEILATNPRLSEWDKLFRGKNIVTLQKISHVSYNNEITLHPSAIFLYANDEFSLFQVVKDRPRQLAEIDKDIKSFLTNIEPLGDNKSDFLLYIAEKCLSCFSSEEERDFYYRYRKIELPTVGDSILCVIKDGNGAYI